MTSRPEYPTTADSERTLPVSVPERLLLAIATLTAVAALPFVQGIEFNDPGLIGIAGYLLIAGTLLLRRRISWHQRSTERRLIRLFLVGLPIVYLIYTWIGEATPMVWGIQIAGFGIWVILAVAAGRANMILWAGCAAHAVWDALHLNVSTLIPTWYVVACVAADLGLAAFVMRSLHRSQAAEESP